MQQKLMSEDLVTNKMSVLENLQSSESVLNPDDISAEIIIPDQTFSESVCSNAILSKNSFFSDICSPIEIKSKVSNVPPLTNVDLSETFQSDDSATLDNSLETMTEKVSSVKTEKLNYKCRSDAILSENSIIFSDTCSPIEIKSEDFNMPPLANVDLSETFQSDDLATLDNNSSETMTEKVSSVKEKKLNYRCLVCNKSFSQKVILSRHYYTHTGERPFQCDVCKKEFSRKGHMKEHYRTHTGEKPHKCHVCGRTFTQKRYKNAHLLTHSSEKPWACDTCDKKFNTKQGLATHYVMHTGEKPYLCEVCNKCFGRRGDLAKHKVIHDNIRCYKCEFCDKAFVHKRSLTKHCTSHTKKLDFLMNLKE